MTDGLFLREQDKQELLRLLARHLPDVTAWAYGSRVNGGAHEGSDLDIVLRSPDLSPIPLEELRAFVQAVRDSNIPILVEARDWARLPESFQQEIMKNYVVLRETVNEWKTLPIHKVGKVITGKTPSKDNPEDWGDAIPFITPSDYKSYKKKAFVSERNISNVGKERLNKKILPPFSVLVTCIGSDMGKVVMNAIPVITNQQINSIVPYDNLVDNHFLYYSMLSMYDILRIYGGDGTAVPIVNKSDFENLEIDIPHLHEQKAIASFLSSLDDKIDLLHRQNKTLEAMAGALFRQWFIEEAGDDWEEGCLSDIADINPRYAMKKGTISTYVEMKSLNTMTFNPDNWIKREFTSGMKFKNNDTLLARITPCLENGKTAFVTILDEDEIGWGSTEYIVIRMKKGYHPFISYIIAKDKEFRDFAIGSMSGSSGRQRAEAEVLKNFDLKIPPRENILNLNTQLSGIVEKLKNNAAQIRTLEKLRDTLLPKLMSGEVRVAYAHEHIE